MQAGHWTAATVLMIGAENGCLKIATGDEGGSGIQWCANTVGTKLVRRFFVVITGLYFLALGNKSVQSIIGATEKRRESGAGVAVVTDMGDMESVRLGGGEFIRNGAAGLGRASGRLSR